MAAPLKLISHKLCPYVQRAVIALTEKGVPFERIDIDLANKPDWFLKISPLGKTPVLGGGRQGDLRIRRDPGISGGNAAEPAASGRCACPRRAPRLDRVRLGRAQRHRRLLRRQGRGDLQGQDRAARAELCAAGRARSSSPWFDGEKFSLVDAVFGPVFRYFDVFDEIGDFGILAGKPKLAQWRKNLAARPSVRGAVSADYPALLRDFIDRRQSWLSQLQSASARR